jgi:hypothetical protein
VIDSFRFKTRMPSRAAAVRELLRRGLGAEGFSTATAGVKSTAYGVTGKTSGKNNNLRVRRRSVMARNSGLSYQVSRGTVRLMTGIGRLCATEKSSTGVLPPRGHKPARRH